MSRGGGGDARSRPATSLSAGGPGRLYRTLRHAAPRQLLWRARREVRSRLPAAWTAPAVPEEVPRRRAEADGELLAALPHTRRHGSAEKRAREVVEGRFRFVGRERRHPREVSWDAPEMPRLWRFHLHYFDYAVDLAEAASGRLGGTARRRLRELQKDWIRSNPPGRGDAWHPYPTSVRLVNWLRAELLLERSGSSGQEDEASRDAVLRSLYAQARAVSADPELDVPGNHLVRNARALLFAGHFFAGDEPEGWTGRARSLLARAVDEQVLEDGGHFERSPAYHVQVLGDFLDLVPLFGPDDPLRADLAEAIRAMARWLRRMRHPDGSLPQFHDGGRWPEADLDALLEGVDALVRSPTASKEDGKAELLAPSGYALLRPAAGALAVLDIGPPGPEHLPAHAHCSLLSLELSLAGERVLVNAGTYGYAAGPDRDAFRGTAAHNTVQVGREEQSEIWSSFRIGRRARALEPFLDQEGDGAVAVRGGYRGFDGNRVRHRRELVQGPGPLWTVVDTLDGPVDERLEVTARWRLAPEATLATLEGPVANVVRGGAELTVRSAEGRWRVEEGTVAPAPGRREPCRVLCLDAAATGGVRVACLLSAGRVAPTVEATENLGHQDAAAPEWRWRLRAAGEPLVLAFPGSKETTTP